MQTKHTSWNSKCIDKLDYFMTFELFLFFKCVPTVHVFFIRSDKAQCFSCFPFNFYCFKAKVWTLSDICTSFSRHYCVNIICLSWITNIRNNHTCRIGAPPLPEKPFTTRQIQKICYHQPILNKLQLPRSIFWTETISYKTIGNKNRLLSAHLEDD